MGFFQRFRFRFNIERGLKKFEDSSGILLMEDLKGYDEINERIGKEYLDLYAEMVDLKHKQFKTPEEMKRYNELVKKTSYAGLRNLSYEVAVKYYEEKAENEKAGIIKDDLDKDSLQVITEKALAERPEQSEQEQKGNEISTQGLGDDTAKSRESRQKSDEGLTL
ncbi:MAG: hypothetical protein ACOYED_03660 [Peptococcia bacterium]|jgi:hypothetical protein